MLGKASHLSLFKKVNNLALKERENHLSALFEDVN